MGAHQHSNEIAEFLDDLLDRLADVDADNLTEQQIRPWLEEIVRAHIRSEQFKQKYRGDRWNTYVGPRWSRILVEKAALNSRLEKIRRTTDQKRQRVKSTRFWIKTLVAVLAIVVAVVIASGWVYNLVQEPQKAEAIIERPAPGESAPIP